MMTDDMNLPSGPPRGRYVVIPGEVISKRDGDRHYVGVGDLLRLYRVPPHANVLILDSPTAHRGYRPHPDDYIVEPRFDGAYPLFEP
jgi:hypothetical protein